DPCVERPLGAMGQFGPARAPRPAPQSRPTRSAMSSDDLRAARDHASEVAGRTRLARLFRLAATLTGAIVALMVVPPWLAVVTPRWLIRGASIAFLWTFFVAYALATPAAGVGSGRSLLPA